MALSDQFDIYQAPGGVTAVTNSVQRQIMAALAQGDKQLPELVEITGKAKSTLSSTHMKDLLNRELVEEVPHPQDGRRKIYRLMAQPLGSSSLPVGELRKAVQAYAQKAVPGKGLRLAQVLEVLAAAPSGSDETLVAQARALGQQQGHLLPAKSPREFAVAFTRFVEEQELAVHLQLDFEGLSFRCRPGSGVESIRADRLGQLLGAFAEGAAKANGLEAVRFKTTAADGAFRLQPV